MEPTRSPLLIDLYELTMLQTYFEHGMTGEAVFEFFVRDAPAKRPYYVAAGLAQLLEWLQNMRFSAEELDWVRDCGHFSAEFADRLEGLRFTGDVHAMPEGTVFFAQEPLVRVRAPLPEAQLIESRLMNIVHFQSLIATKAARCVQAADGRAVVDFGLRRAHGAEAGLWAARAAYIAGFAASATCLANALYGVPVTGTMAHSFVLAHDDERAAFRRFAHSHPDNVVLLIDTYDTEAAAREVVELARELEADGIGVKAVRLDSGDLGRHATLVRQILDQGGQQDVRILASGGLDEFGIRELVEGGAPIDGFGVGSKVDTSADLPFLDSAYKLHAYAGEPRRKRSEGKEDLPGSKQVYRSWDGQGRLSRDVIGLDGEDCEGQPLLRQVMAGGAPLAAPEPLDVLRERCAESLASLPERWRDLDGAESTPAVLSDGLQELRRRMDETD